ncbi:MAG: hypothetical protein MJ041_01685 [Acidaminococcaceae bacterium]|nr:hypothetical protein [Acidaminococcaceae bacterium]
MDILKTIEKVIMDDKKCEQCGSTEDVKLVSCSSITGRPVLKRLCRRCAMAESLKRY